MWRGGTTPAELLNVQRRSLLELARQEHQRRRRWRDEQRRRARMRALPGQISPFRRHVILKAPRTLQWTPEKIVEMLEFIQRLRVLALSGRQPVLLDLATCTYIDPVSCLLLTAEVERCLLVKPGCLSGRDTPSPRAQFVLEAMGFYRHLGLPPPLGRRFDNILQIQTGGLPREGETKNAGQQVYNVAKLAHTVFGDADFADYVHGALNEAADNVISWAYDEDLVDPATCLRRWWVAGVTNADERRGIFFAYDQGASIPRTAPRNLGEALAAVLAAAKILPAEAGDHDLLQATIKERRTRSGKSGRGKGLGRMLELIDRVETGQVWIYSGGAQYAYVRELGREPFEHSSALRYKFPGTLVVWMVERPLTRREDGHDGDDENPTGERL